MLIGVGGRERSEAEFGRLFDGSGFAIDSLRPLVLELSLLDCRASEPLQPAGAAPRHDVLPCTNRVTLAGHAAVRRWPLLTRDATRFRTYFPGLQVLAP